MLSKPIVVLGGGFAGVMAAKTLRKLLPADQYKIVLFSQENHMVFYPLLAEVAAAAISPKDMAAPLRELLPDVECRTESVVEIDLIKNFVTIKDPDEIRKSFDFEHLIIACGNMTNLAFIPGMADHAFSLKSVSDALRIQAHIIEQLERAEIEENDEKRRWILSFVIVGGGFSGVEVAGEINELLRISCKFYRNFKESDIKVTLVHSHDQILPEVGSNLRELARKKMESNGAIFRLNSSASFKPFKEALASASRRRTNNIANFPKLQEMIDQISLASLIEPLPYEPIRVSEPISEVIYMLNKHQLDCIFITNDEQKLIGAVKRHDLMNWIEALAADLERGNTQLTAGNWSLDKPICVSSTAVSSAKAIQLMRQNAIDRLPVVDHNEQLLGVLRLENVMEHVLREVSKAVTKRNQPTRHPWIIDLTST
jgi:CBS domain-containing protein